MATWSKCWASTAGILKAVEGVSTPEMVMVNEMVSLYRWLGNQYLAGVRKDLPSEKEMERILEEHYKK